MALKSPLIVTLFPLFFFFMLSSPVLSLCHPPWLEEKTRLGSTPPSCYSKCNQCHPCTAVKVPTFPSHHRVQFPTMSSVVYDSFSGDNRKHSNYKPLGWKCRCKDHLYNP